jgi:hypothetical protein
MSAVILSFPDRRANRPAPINPVQDVTAKVRAYCHKLALSDFDRNSVMRAVEHWQQCGLRDDQVAARGMAFANRVAMSQPDPSGPKAA